MRVILAWLKLELHPGKTRRVNLSWGHGGFDFLGCHLRKCMSGPIWERLHGFLVKRKGRHLRAGQVERWTRDFFHGHGLYRLRGTVRYPEAASCHASIDNR